jgi:hypothetical protein
MIPYSADQRAPNRDPDVHRHYQLAFVYTVLYSRIGKNLELTANVGEKEGTGQGTLFVQKHHARV